MSAMHDQARQSLIDATDPHYREEAPLTHDHENGKEGQVDLAEELLLEDDALVLAESSQRCGHPVIRSIAA